MEADVDPLGSQQDANFLLRGPSGEPVGVLKIANPAFSRAELEAQDGAAAFIAAGEDIRTAVNVAPDAADSGIAEADGFLARIIRYLPGGTLSGERYLRPAQVAALGDLAGPHLPGFGELRSPRRRPGAAVGFATCQAHRRGARGPHQ